MWGGDSRLEASADVRARVAHAGKVAVEQTRAFENRTTASRQFVGSVYQDARSEEAVQACALEPHGAGSSLESALMRAQYTVIGRAPGSLLPAAALRSAAEGLHPVPEPEPEPTLGVATRRRG